MLYKYNLDYPKFNLKLNIYDIYVICLIIFCFIKYII